MTDEHETDDGPECDTCGKTTCPGAQAVDVHRCESGCCESPWAEQSYTEYGGSRRGDITHLVLEDPRPLTNPIPCKGRLGLWATTPDVDEAVRLDLAGEDWTR